MEQHELRIERLGGMICVTVNDDIVFRVEDIKLLCTTHERVGEVEVFSYIYDKED